MNTMHPIPNNRDRRGAALISVAFIALFLAALLVIAFTQSYNSSRTAVMRENYSKAVAAAEYGAELAMAQLLTVKRDDDTGDGKQGEITGDFVFGEFKSTNDGNMYATSGGKSLDQRRIAGIMDNQQFRVRVRSARLAYDGETMDVTWLNDPGDFDYDAPTGDFGDIYEITATAQNHLAATGQAVQANLYPTAVVRTVVKMANTGAGDALEDIGTLDANPEHIQASNMTISGEDHNLRTFYIEGGKTAEATYTKVQQSGASSADFTGVAEGKYWQWGETILNYMRGDTPVPFYPFNKTLPEGEYDDPSRKLVSMGTYIVDDPIEAATVGRNANVETESGNAANKVSITASGGTPVLVTKQFEVDGSEGSQGAQTDIYLIGGKSLDEVGYSGRAYESHPWYLESQGEKFDIVLSDFDDLIRIYSVHHGGSDKNPKPEKTSVSLSSSPTAPGVSGGASEVIIEDKTVTNNEMNFVGGKVLSNQRPNPSSLPYYTDPFDNSAIDRRDEPGFARYFGRQYVLRTNPVSGKQEMLVMKATPKTLKKLTLKGYLEGSMVKEFRNGSSTEVHPIRYTNNYTGSNVKLGDDWDASEFDGWTTKVGWGEKKVLWGVVGTPSASIVCAWNEEKGRYWPVDESVAIQVKVYPADWNPENVSLGAMRKLISKIWPNILNHPIDEAAGIYALKWSEFSFIGVDGVEQKFEGFSESPETVYASSRALIVEFPGFLADEHVISVDSAASGQWFEWDGTYTWSEYLSAGDGGDAHFENGSRDSFAISNGRDSAWEPVNEFRFLSEFNVMPRPFEVDEIMGMKVDHDYTTVWSNRYSLVSPVDADGYFIEKAEDHTYPENIPLALTGPVKNGAGDWSFHRGDETGQFNLNPELGLTGLWVWEPNDPEYRPYDPENPDNANPKLFRTISDFMEKRQFVVANADGTTGTLERDALTLWVAIEDMAYNGADWDYNDVAFIVSIAPPVAGEVGQAFVNSAEKLNKQWWEQHEQEGLTGGKSNAAISSNRIEGSDDVSAAYAKLWNKLTASDWFSLTPERRLALCANAKKQGIDVSLLEGEWCTAASIKDIRNGAFEDPDIKTAIIAVLASDVWSMMDGDSKSYSYTDFVNRGEFYCDYAFLSWSNDGSFPIGVRLREADLVRSDDGLTRLYYSDNDIEYYRAVCDTVYSDIWNVYRDPVNPDQVIFPDTADFADMKLFFNTWKDMNREGKLKYAAARLVYLFTGVADPAYPSVAFNYQGKGTFDETSISYSDKSYLVEFIDQRFYDLHHLLVAVNGENNDLNALRIRKNGITAREYTAAIYNQKETLVRQSMLSGVTFCPEHPAADSDTHECDYRFLKPEGMTDYITKAETLTFIAGEARQDVTQSTFTPTGTPIPFNENVTAISGERKEISSDFLAESEDPKDLAMAVRAAYQPYYANDPDTVAAIYEAWGLKDNRRSIGWHRYGSADPDEDPELYQELVDRYLLDNLEVTMIGVKNFMPYNTIIAPEGVNTGKKLVQRRRYYNLPETDPDFSATRTPYYEEVPLRTSLKEYREIENSDPTADREYMEFLVEEPEKLDEYLPTFVFPPPNEYLPASEKDMYGPIDGAGILVVNGNLLIKDTFAFHGILIVLGALEIQATLNEDRIVYGNDGNPYFMSKDGNNYSLRRDARGEWYYEDDNGEKVYEHTYSTVDEHGNVVTETEKVTAATAKEAVANGASNESLYTGRLVVQGGVIAGGEITTTGNDKGQVGAFEVYHSQTILDELGKIYPEGSAYLERLVWDHNDFIDVKSIWNDELDPGDGRSGSAAGEGTNG